MLILMLFSMSYGQKKKLGIFLTYEVGNNYIEKKNYTKSLEYFEKIYKKFPLHDLSPIDHEDVLEPLYFISKELGNKAQARKYLKELLEYRKQKYPVGHIKVRETEKLLANGN